VQFHFVFTSCCLAVELSFLRFTLWKTTMLLCRSEIYNSIRSDMTVTPMQPSTRLISQSFFYRTSIVLWVFRRHRLQAIPPVSIRGVSVCHFRELCVNGRRYRHDFFCLAPCLFQIVLNFGLHRSTPFSPNFAPNWLTPCWFQSRRHLMENYDLMVRDSAMIIVESL